MKKKMNKYKKITQRQKSYRQNIEVKENMIRKIEWNIIKIKIGELKDYEKNPRKITVTEQNRLKKSIKEFNLVEKPVLNYDKMIIAGHQRVKILKSMYSDDHEIECIVANRLLTKKEIEKYNLISNKHNGSWDMEKLNKIDSDLVMELNLKIDKNGKIKGLKIYDEIPEMELQYDEKYDYIVFLFRNRFDFQYIEQYFKLEQVRHMNKIGMGRVIDGKKLIDMIKDEKN